jgi:hypothetical protein
LIHHLNQPHAIRTNADYRIRGGVTNTQRGWTDTDIRAVLAGDFPRVARTGWRT